MILNNTLSFNISNYNTLIMQNPIQSQQNIWIQMKQVQRLQQRTVKFINMYEKFILKSQEENQFLRENDNIIEINEKQRRKDLIKIQDKTQVYQYYPCNRTIAEQNNVNDKNMDLSRIFKEITLGDEINLTNPYIKVNLEYQSNQIHLSLKKNDNSFNLSNFSSFNNNKTNDNVAQFDIEDLLYTIQQKTGKQLSKKGIDNIINQLQMNVISQMEQMEIMKQSQITQHSLFHSHINNSNLDPKDKLFSIQFNSKQQLRQSSKLNIVNNQNFDSDKKISKQKTHFDGRLNKQNNQKLFYKKKKAEVSKQIRIIKKNSFKNSLIMNYTDTKQLQNFCISNKIYGKDKQKILKAIRENKNIITLD